MSAPDTRRRDHKRKDAADRGVALICGRGASLVQVCFSYWQFRLLVTTWGHMSANYGQFCPVAKASEIFATRWTPLIVRELIAGAHSFNDIHRGVPLISRAVLVARLRELENHGGIEHRPRADGKGHE